MITTYIAGHFIAFACAMIAFVYSDVLTEPGMILNKFYKWLERWLSPEFDLIFKPIIGCFRCVAGQLSLWVFLKYLWIDYKTISYQTLFIHLYFISLTIYITWMISKAYRANP